MSVALFTFLMLFVPQFWAWRRGLRAGPMLGLLGATLLLVLATQMASLLWLSQIAEASDTSGRRDTYYIVFHAQYTFSLALLIGALSLITLGVERLSQTPPRKLSRGLALLTALTLSLLMFRNVLVGSALSAPVRLDGFELWLSSSRIVLIVTGPLLALAIVSLLGLAVFALLRALDRWSKTR